MQTLELTGFQLGRHFTPEDIDSGRQLNLLNREFSLSQLSTIRELLLSVLSTASVHKLFPTM